MTRTELRALYRRELARFTKVYPRVAGTKLEIVDVDCPGQMEPDPGTCRKRDLAMFVDRRSGGLAVILAARILALPRRNIIAIVRHELGHASDVNLGRPGSEQRADDIAEEVGGQRINYDRYDSQTIGPGRYPRPKYLHR
jgi:hypothetical protein